MGGRKVIGWRVLLTAGLTLINQQAVLANPEVAEKLTAGVWRSLVVGGRNIHDYPLTPLGLERYETFPLDRDPSLRCEPPGMPRAFYHLSPMDFALDGDELTVRYETMDVVRSVHLSGSPPPPDAPHTPNGHAIGHWDGDELVIETTHLTAGETTRDGIPKSARMTLLETFSIEDREDGPRLIVSMTITDPENFAVPFTSVNEFVLEPGWELLPFDCQPTEY